MKAKKLGSYFKISTVSPMECLHFNDAVEAELNSYIVTPAIDGEEDPLAWWKQHQVNFPRLRRLVCWYPCVPATGSQPERLFIAAGNIVPCKWACLKKVDMLFFLSNTTLPWTMWRCDNQDVNIFLLNFWPSYSFILHFKWQKLLRSLINCWSLNLGHGLLFTDVELFSVFVFLKTRL